MINAEDAVIATETGEGAFQVRIQTGEQSFLMDEPVAYGGLSSGPSPFEMLCAALGACTLMTMKLYAKRKGWTVGPLSVRVAHQKGSPDGRDRFERTLELGQVTEEQRDGLLKIAERCPVHLLFERGAEVSTDVAEAELEAAKAGGVHEQVIDKLCRDAA